MLYRILKIIVSLGVRLFYRELKVKHSEHLEHDGPMIIIANHPNTLMDAWIVGMACKKQIYFMAKGTFFNSKFKRYLLKQLNMIPVNRRVDGKIAGVDNDSTFEACYQLLEEGKTLVIFPEGSSYSERQLRELKSGTARIALEAEKRNQGKLNLKVVPMGLFYSEAERFRSSVMVTLGKGIKVVDYLAQYEENISGTAKKLTEKFRIHLEGVLVTTDNKDQEQLLETIVTIFKGSEKLKSVESGAEFMKKVKSKFEEIQLVRPYEMEEVQLLVNAIEWQSRKLEIHADFINRRFRSRLYLMQIFLSILFLLIGLPLFIFGFIHNFLQYKLTDLLVPKMTKHVEYHAAIGVLLGLVFYPLFYTGFLLTMKHILNLGFWSQLLYFISMPLTGIYAFTFVKWNQRINHKWKYLFLIMKESDAIKELQALRTKLEKLLL